jgi:hypothetical protein
VPNAVFTTNLYLGPAAINYLYETALKWHKVDRPPMPKKDSGFAAKHRHRAGHCSIHLGQSHRI